MDSQQIKLIVEGALLASGRALSLQELGNLFDANGRPSNAQFREVLAQINEDCEDRAFELREVGSGFRFQVRQQFGTWVSRLWEEKPARYSRALLETLALVAYRQPVTRAEIEEVRGVSVSTNIIKTLLERSWVKVVGHRDTPGKPAMYATTRQFLDYFNLKTLGELPSLADIKEITSLNQELELEAAITIGLGSGDAGADLNEAGTDAANEPENEADTDTSNEGANEILAEVEVNSTTIDAESDADSDETTHSHGLESANTAACVTEVDLHGVADHDAEIDDSEIEGLDEDTADSQLPAYSQSHS
ncbi:MAG: SMC-Scp complex subunit ScpB [Pseudomonadales bacterium]